MVVIQLWLKSENAHLRKSTSMPLSKMRPKLAPTALEPNSFFQSNLGSVSLNLNSTLSNKLRFTRATDGYV